MKKITVAKTAGFCFGVDRAVSLVYKLLDEGKRVCTLGPIIHNPQMVEELAQKGVIITESVDDVPNGYTVVIRSHGVDRSVYEQLSTRALDYCDATCPFVSKIHKIVSENTDFDTPLFIAGDENHAEVIGIMGHANGKVYCFSDIDDLKIKLEKSNIMPNRKYFFLMQIYLN